MLHPDRYPPTGRDEPCCRARPGDYQLDDRMTNAYVLRRIASLYLLISRRVPSSVIYVPLRLKKVTVQTPVASASRVHYEDVT